MNKKILNMIICIVSILLIISIVTAVKIGTFEKEVDNETNDLIEKEKLSTGKNIDTLAGELYIKEKEKQSKAEIDNDLLDTCNLLLAEGDNKQKKQGITEINKILSPK